MICIVAAAKTLITKQYAYYDVEKITPQLLACDESEGLFHIIDSLTEIIKTNRAKNDKKAKSYNLALKAVIVCAFCICIFVNT